MKRLRNTVMAGLLAVGTLGAASTPAQASGKVYRVDFIFTGFAYPYFAPMYHAVNLAAKHFPDLRIKEISCNNSGPTETSQVDEAVASGVQGIILNTVEESVTAAAQKATAAGIPVITIDRDVSSPSARVAFIGDNDFVLGETMTKNALADLSSHKVPKPWHVVLLEGTLGSSTAIGRLDGALAVLKPYEKNGSVKVILNTSANFATNTAQSVMSAELAKTTNIQLVISGNDAMALGVETAIKDHGIAPGKILVTGADAQPQSLTAIKQGWQLNTVTHSPYLEAFWAVEAMNNYLQYKIKPPAKFKNGNILIPMNLVTKANVGSVGAWGTPKVIPKLPYGKSQTFNT
ncbi:MAG: sugar ABC transporter substrate-binding protein [Actinomycetota bacterium]|jgi:ABC-type sugar transport system substrate-binding protein|nr:sugar ABC transporter substrate-binding protein [Actinomycetota bacterium]